VAEGERGVPRVVMVGVEKEKRKKAIAAL
jgi:hypothetical protein